MKASAKLMVPLSLVVAAFAIGQNNNPNGGGDLRSRLAIDASAPERSSIQSGYAKIVERVSPSVVTIVTSAKARSAGPGGMPEDLLNDPFFRRFFGDQFDPRQQPQQMPRQQGQGSGVILTADGYIATNNHVVDGAEEIRVILPNRGGEHQAKVVGRDPATDIALIKIDANNLSAATLADSSQLKVGDTVLAIGNPFGLNQTVTSGIVSALSRRNLNIAGYENFIQTDASINPGNSGGALVDHLGRVVGINTAIFSRAGGNIGIGFAIPVNMVVDITDRLVTDGSIQRGYLGVTLGELTSELAQGFGIQNNKGVLVNDVMEDTPAQKAGFKPGDVIVAFQGTEVSDMSDLRMMVANTRPGTQAEFSVIRDGKEQRINVAVGQLPTDQPVAGGGQPAPSPQAQEFLAGVEITGLTADLRSRYSLPEDTSGVVVTKVDANSAAARAGLSEGDVISSVARRQVTSVRDAVNALKEVRSRVVLLRIVNAQGSRFMAVER